MKPKTSFPAIYLALIALATSAGAQVAITEFLADPDGLPDADGEFVELFNYGTQELNLKGWAISDEDSDDDVISDTDLFLMPGSYLVVAKNKAALEGAFFSGAVRPDIVQQDQLTIANSADEIILKDNEGAHIWSLAYPGGVSRSNAAFLSENDFTTTVWGSQAEPGIHFTDLDPATNTLGYQNNNVTTDPDAITTEGGDTASPLAGFYTIGGGSGPEPDDGFRILSIVPGEAPDTFTITFASEEGISYTTESSPDLSDESFTDGEVIVATGSTTSYDAVAIGDRRYFRVSKPVAVDP